MKIGILGATGAVGRQMLECIEERRLKAEEIRLFASEKSRGKTLDYQGRPLSLETVSPERLQGLDYVLGAVSNALSKQYRPLIEKAGAVYIDNSSAFRLEDGVPLVVPEINGEDARHHHGVIANPNCSTIITVMAVYPISRISPIRKMIASTYQAVSGAGIGGIQELHQEVLALERNEPVHPDKFPAQIAYNCIPWIGSEAHEGYSTEEEKMENEGRKIMHLPDLKVTCTCVRVPVYRSHSISVSVQCEQPVSVRQAEEAIAAFPGDRLIRDGLPMPIDTSNQDLVFAGRVRPDHVLDGGLSLWCCGDQIRKGAAANAVEILEYLEKR